MTYEFRPLRSFTGSSEFGLDAKGEFASPNRQGEVGTQHRADIWTGEPVLADDSLFTPRFNLSGWMNTDKEGSARRSWGASAIQPESVSPRIQSHNPHDPPQTLLRLVVRRLGVLSRRGGDVRGGTFPGRRAWSGRVVPPPVDGLTARHSSPFRIV